MPVIGFKMGEYEPLLRDSKKIDLVCHLEENEWNGLKKIQLRAVDFKVVDQYLAFVILDFLGLSFVFFYGADSVTPNFAFAC